jgi:hypothetical protein
MAWKHLPDGSGGGSSGSSSVSRATPAAATAGDAGFISEFRKQTALRMYLLNIEPIGERFTRIQVVVSNASGHFIGRAEVSAVLYDAATNKIGFDRDTVVYSSDGGLAAGATVHHTFQAPFAPDRVSQVSFQVESVR